TARVWDSKGKLLATLQHQGSVNSASFSPNGEQIVTASDDKTARVWDSKGKLLATLQHQGSVNSASFSPNGEQIVTASDDKTALVYTVKGLHQLLAIGCQNLILYFEQNQKELEKFPVCQKQLEAKNY
ncbi:MAG: WD40 repeat domain-containing protein, partial [Nostoc sp. CmiSLP01]|nr:hypothetical protein [Nostoc sp. CmiSLP01]